MNQHSTRPRSGFRWTLWLPLFVAMILVGNSGISQAGHVPTVQRINEAAVVAPTQTESVTPLANIVQVAAGSNSHTCALTTTGGIKCWGYNSFGQLGTGDTDNRAIPANVMGLDSGMAAVATGSDHSCALTTAGGVKCWGKNNYGQLGDGTGGEGKYKTTPVDVVGYTSGVTAVAAGGDHTCVLTTAGGVKCWGTVDPGLDSDVIAIAAGGSLTCVLTTAGGVKCWGYTTLEDVTGLGSGVTAIAAGGGHICALTTAGGVKCWGDNSRGQLGDGTTTQRLTPVDVAEMSSGVTAISAGRYHTCALAATGGVKCWGWNQMGQLGDGTAGDGTDKSTPVDVSGLSSGVTAITAGGAHTCALTTVGGVKCWGSNGAGQLGNDTGGNGTDKSTPVDVVEKYQFFLPQFGAQQVSAGSQHACILTNVGGVKCWGANYSGQLGDGTGFPKAYAVNTAGLNGNATAITAGSTHTCTLTSTGGVKCWGSNHYGQLGNGTSGYGTDSTSPGDVTGLSSNVSAVSAGANHTCAVTSEGGVKCWGDNSAGQLGDGTPEQRLTPVDVLRLSGVRTISAGGSHTCALTSVGAVKCWGRNNYGQLGDGTDTWRSAPVDVPGMSSGILAIAAGGAHTCALTSAGAVKCWGRNSYGQLGDGTMDSKSTPTDVVGLGSDVVAITGGGSHTCALTTVGEVKCWGDRYEPTPASITGLSSEVTLISAGSDYTCGRTAASGVKCWGQNFYGQLGNNTKVSSPTPVDVLMPFDRRLFLPMLVR